MRPKLPDIDLNRLFKPLLHRILLADKLCKFLVKIGYQLFLFSDLFYQLGVTVYLILQLFLLFFIYFLYFLDIFFGDLNACSHFRYRNGVQVLSLPLQDRVNVYYLLKCARFNVFICIIFHDLVNCLFKEFNSYVLGKFSAVKLQVRVRGLN